MLFGGSKKEKKVLIIEDDIVLRSALAEKCKEEKWEVVALGDTQTLQAVLEKEKPAALILDLLLPQDDGMTVLEKLRASGNTIPVIVLSNLLGSENLLIDIERLGAVFFNKTAVMLEDVVRALEEHTS